MAAQPSWEETQRMPMLTRYAHLYTRAMHQGMIVDWATGRITPPRK